MYRPDLKSIGNSQYALELNPTTSPIGLITDKTYDEPITRRNILETIMILVVFAMFFIVPFTIISFTHDYTIATMSILAVFIVACIALYVVQNDFDGVLDVIMYIFGYHRVKQKHALKAIVETLNEIYVVNNEHIVRLWQYLDVDKSTPSQLVFDFSQFDEYLMYGESLKIRQYHEESDDDLMEIILSEAENVERITESTVIDISHIIIENHILKEVEEKQKRMTKIVDQYKSINQDTTILEQSLNGVKNKLNGSEKL